MHEENAPVVGGIVGHAQRSARATLLLFSVIHVDLASWLLDPRRPWMAGGIWTCSSRSSASAGFGPQPVQDDQLPLDRDLRRQRTNCSAGRETDGTAFAEATEGVVPRAMDSRGTGSVSGPSSAAAAAKEGRAEAYVAALQRDEIASIAPAAASSRRDGKWDRDTTVAFLLRSRLRARARSRCHRARVPRRTGALLARQRGGA